MSAPPVPGLLSLVTLVSAVVLGDTIFYSAITPLLPAYAEELGLSKTGAGLLEASYAAGTLVAAVPAGVLAARVGVRRTVLTGLALLGVSSLVFGLARSVVLLDAARFAQGVGGACSWAGALAWLVRRAPADRRGELIGPDTVNTMPDATVDASRDHATAERTVDRDVQEAHDMMRRVREAGVDVDDIVSRQLVDEGVESFAKSFDSLIETIAEKASSLSPAAR